MIAYVTDYKNKPSVQWTDFLLFGVVWMTCCLEFWRTKEWLFNGCAIISVFYLKTGRYVLLLTHITYARGIRCESIEEHTGVEKQNQETHPFLCGHYEEAKQWNKNSHGRRVTQLLPQNCCSYCILFNNSISSETVSKCLKSFSMSLNRSAVS